MGLMSSLFGGSKSSSQSNSWVWGPQADALSGLYQSAGRMLRPAQTGIQNLTFGSANQPGLLDRGQGMVGQLGTLGQVGNPFVQQQIGQLGSQLGSFFQNQINPSIRSDFAGMGQLGSSRQAVAQGLATDSLFRNFASGATDLLGNSANLAVQANQAGLGALGGLQSLGIGGYFGPSAALASILGNPTVLNNSTGSSRQQNGMAQSIGGFLGGLGAFLG